jgi:hypothetical protein
MAMGSRVQLLGREIRRYPSRRYLRRVASTAVAHVLRTPLNETRCGANLLRVTPEPESVLAAPRASRWLFDVELLRIGWHCR